MGTKTSLMQISIASPCTTDWSQMQGDDHSRFYDSCQKHVYNFVAMTEEEGIELITATEGKFCGRLSRRHDGTLITKDCPVGWAKLIYRRCAYAVLAACLLILSFIWVRSQPAGHSPFVDRMQEWIETSMEKIGWRTQKTFSVTMGMPVINIPSKPSEPCENGKKE